MIRLFKQIATKAAIVSAPSREFSHLKFLTNAQPRIETIGPEFPPPHPKITRFSARYLDPTSRIIEVIELGRSLTAETTKLSEQLDLTNRIVKLLPVNQLISERLLKEETVIKFLNRMIDTLSTVKSPEQFASGVLNVIALNHKSSPLNEKLLNALLKNPNFQTLPQEDLRKVFLFFNQYRYKLKDSVKELDELILSAINKNIANLDADSLATALLTYRDISAAQKDSAKSQELTKLLETYGSKLKSNLSLGSQAKALYLSALEQKESEITKLYGEKVFNNLIELPNEDLPLAAEALDLLNVKSEEIWEDLELVVHSKVAELTVSELTQLATVIARRRPEAVKLLAIIDQHIGLNYEQIFPKEASQLLVAYATSGKYRDSFINLLREYFLENTSRFAPSEIVRSLYGLAITRRLSKDVVVKAESLLAVTEERTLTTEELTYLLIALDSQGMYQSKSHELYGKQIEELVKKPVEVAYGETKAFVTPALLRYVANGRADLKAEFETNFEKILSDKPTQQNIEFTLQVLETVSKKELSSFYEGKLVPKLLETAAKLVAAASKRTVEVEEIEFLIEMIKMNKKN